MEITRRNAALEAQLAQRGLVTRDVQADGNCLFRAVSFVINSHEGDHESLRAATASHVENSECILDGLLDKSSDDDDSFREHIVTLHTVGNAAGEDAKIALTEVVHREIDVFIADADLLTYKPTIFDINVDPVRISLLSLANTWQCYNGDLLRQISNSASFVFFNLIVLYKNKKYCILMHALLYINGTI